MLRRGGVSAAICGLLAIALMSLAAPSASAADPAYEAPVVGQCFDMSAAELGEASYPEAAVDCGAEHTSRVIAVAQLPDRLTYESRGLLRFALESCLPAQRKVLGTNQRGLRLTAYHLGYFAPTTEQQAAGARWLRCDLVLVAGKRLAPLPGRLTVGTFPYSSRVSRCLAGRDFTLTVCAQKHSFRATAAIKVDVERFPSKHDWQRIGGQRCRHAVTSRSFRFGWPSKAAWKAGDRTLLCYSRTRH